MKTLPILFLAAVLMTVPLTLFADQIGAEDPPDLPEFKGDLQGLDYLVVYKSPSLWVISVAGKLYVYWVVN